MNRLKQIQFELYYSKFYWLDDYEIRNLLENGNVVTIPSEEVFWKETLSDIMFNTIDKPTILLEKFLTEMQRKGSLLDWYIHRSEPDGIAFFFTTRTEKDGQIEIKY